MSTETTSDRPTFISIVPCSLGWAGIVAGEDGVRGLELGDEPEHVRSRIWSRYPDAVLHNAGDPPAEVVERIVGCIDEPSNAMPPQIAPIGTDFQQVVWQAIREVPAGRTITYKELARRVGREDAVRAVAGACAANPIAVLIPCHRIVGSDGAITGYRWGVERKRALLAREGAGTMGLFEE